MFSVSSHVATASIEPFYCEIPSFTANRVGAFGENWLPVEENAVLWSTAVEICVCVCYAGVLRELGVWLGLVGLDSAQREGCGWLPNLQADSSQ